MKVSPAELDQLRALRKIRDEAAGMLGAALIEFERTADFHKKRIADASEAERKLGRAILEHLGLPDEQEHRINPEGVVQRLDAGQWVEAE